MIKLALSDATVKHLSDELSKMNSDMARLRDEMMSMWKVIKDKKVCLMSL